MSPLALKRLLPALLPLLLLLGWSPQGAAKAGREVRVLERPMPLELDPSAPKITWSMPPLGEDAAPFSWLEGEDATLSRSIGTTSDGYLVGGKRFAYPQPHLAQLEVQGQRYLHHTGDPMLGLLASAAAFVAAAHPGSVTYLGNLSKQGGGDIFYSVSHNSGRDADVAFFLTDAQGAVAAPWDLLPLDEEGRYVDPEDVTKALVFDLPRNWAFVKGLLAHTPSRIQFIFVADWLRDAMLAFAKAQNEPASLIARARALMRQPRVTLPHNDHFHIRIDCTPADLSAGCVHGGSSPGGRTDHTLARLQTLKLARQELGAQDAAGRVAAVRRLALLGDTTSWQQVAHRLEDEEAAVRVAAVRALEDLGKGAAEVRSRWAVEQDPAVQAELIRALAAYGDKASILALTAALAVPLPLKLTPEVQAPLDRRLLIVDALATTQNTRAVAPLLDLLAAPSSDATLQAQVAHALGLLTNHRFLLDWEAAPPQLRTTAVELWQQWWKRSRRLPRTRWVLEGFKAAGYPIEGLGRAHIWSLTRAIEAPRHLSYNAQLVMIDLSKNDPGSLAWSKEDASFYWRRWFERRRGRFGLPRAPRDLTTMVKTK